jgi:DNA-3-methyladenine glycosylase I
MPPRTRELVRCDWCLSEPIYIAYHDEEWGVPEHDDRALFEKLILDGFQAGLSWITILKKRENFRRAFDGFDPYRIARYRDAKLAKLLADPGIVRNRQKVAASVTNARAWLDVMETEGSFDRFLWGFVDGKPLKNARRAMRQIPAKTPESEAMSAALTERGFRFVGPTICYAYMQAVGMVNDHLVDCHRYEACSRS